MTSLPLLPLPDSWEPTRSTLHSYANAVGAVARAHAIPHPKWWHISLEVTPVGLVTEPMSLPAGGTFWLRMNLVKHQVLVETSAGWATSVPMSDGLTGSQFGAALVGLVEDLGADGDYAREKFESDAPVEYRPEDAAAFFAALVNIEHNLQQHRVSLGDSVGPLQIWPHGFDLAFEWFGAGESQINLGFYPAGRPYFYSNPWPFDPGLTGTELPSPASWHTGDWDGSILYYDDLLAREDPAAKLLEYAKSVYEAAAPGLR
jgi:Family of unknown function (DUF5996)